MSTFADEVSRDIRQSPAFWTDLASLRAVGIRSTLSAPINAEIGGTLLGEGAVARLFNSASVLAIASDEQSKDLAQQIAVFGSLVTDDQTVHAAAAHVLAGLGNFPGLARMERGKESEVNLQAYLRRSLLATLNTVTIGGREVPLTEFQLDVWSRLKSGQATAISAPTSAGKSYVVLEHLCELACTAKRFNALYIAPTRALLNEIHGKLEKRLAQFADSTRVTTIPISDSADRPRQIYVLTQERAQLLLASLDVRGLFDLVIVDEAQAIGDESRGMILQDVLESLRGGNRQTRFLFLAPGASGFEHLEDAVGLDDLVVAETSLSPVVQNRISIDFSAVNEHEVTLNLVTSRGPERVGVYEFSRGFALNEDGRLAACAVEFGSTGRSLVYATGPKNAEDLAALLALSRESKKISALTELAEFVEKHVHKQYSLAHLIRRGVAFHYGSMPSLLRESIESAFRNGEIDFLCCTTTLFQGVNLPARNVFIDTPTRGKGDLLDEAALWNFAGRAGRLGEEVVGNVFLVNYSKWDSQPLTTRKPFAIRVAFKQAINSDYEKIVELLHGAAGRDLRSINKFSSVITSAAGLILLRQSQGTLRVLLGRRDLDLDLSQKEELHGASAKVLEVLGLPTGLLTTNWMISPLALSALLERFRKGIRKGELQSLMPVNPSTDAYKVYSSIFRRLFKYLGGVNLSGDEGKKVRGYVNHVSVTALKWMRGEPLTQLVNESVRYKVATKKPNSKVSQQATIDAAIRDMFSLVENTIRFQLVQWGKAYVDLLRFSLEEAGEAKAASQVYDFSLALELGISTGTGRALMEVGLSRIAASAVAPRITDSTLSAEQVKLWLREQPESLLGLSGLILSELRSKRLVADEES